MEIGDANRVWRVIDSSNCHNGYKGPIAQSIVRLLYENAFRFGIPRTPTSEPRIPLQFDGLAEYVLKKVGHGSECRKPVLEIAFMAVLLIYVTPGITIPAVISEVDFMNLLRLLAVRMPPCLTKTRLGCPPTDGE